MNKKVSASYILSMLFFILSISFCYAEDWELIGEKKTVKNSVAIEIEISGQNDFYKELKFGVKTGNIKIKEVIAFSPDGDKVEFMIEAPEWIEPGKTTPSILISEEGLALQKIKLIFFARKQVIVEFYGKKALPEKDEKALNAISPE